MYWSKIHSLAATGKLMLIFVLICIVSCREEEELVFNGSNNFDNDVIVPVNGTEWVDFMPELSGSVLDLITYKNQLVFSFRSMGQIGLSQNICGAMSENGDLIMQGGLHPNDAGLTRLRKFIVPVNRDSKWVMEELLFSAGLLGQSGVVMANQFFKWNDYVISNSFVNDCYIENYSVIFAANEPPFVRIRREPGVPVETLGDEFDSAVLVLCPYNGDIVAGGMFNAIGGKIIHGVARWDGNEWLPMGDGLNGTVYDMVVHNGMLFACGDFTGSGSTILNRIAVWEKGVWHPLGEGLSGKALRMCSYGSDLIIGGEFLEAGGKTAKHIVIWNNNRWKFLPQVPVPINAMAVFNGQLYIANAYEKDIPVFLRLE